MFSANFKNFLKNPDKFPLFLSVLLHGVLILILIINFAKYKNKEFPNQVKIVELVFPISNKTNLPPAKAKEKKPVTPEKEKKEPKKQEPKKPESVKEPKKTEPPKKTPEKTIPEPIKKPEINKKENKDQAAKPTPAKKNEPEEKQLNNEQKKNNDSMDDLLKSLEGQAIEQTTLESELESLNSSDSFDDTQNLSISEIDAIKSQIQKCWTEPAGGLKKDGLGVLLKIKLLIDGNVEDIKVKESPKTENAIMNQLAIDTAIRAIKMCAPYKMPMNSYNSWKELEIMFDPKEM
jgi:outer membrane biosynthesis protein TonB